MSDFPEPLSFNGGPDETGVGRRGRRLTQDDEAICYFCGDVAQESWQDGNGHIFCSRDCSDKYADERYISRDARRI